MSMLSWNIGHKSVINFFFQRPLMSVRAAGAVAQDWAATRYGPPPPPTFRLFEAPSKRNVGGGDGPWCVAAQSWAVASAALTNMSGRWITRKLTYFKISYPK